MIGEHQKTMAIRLGVRWSVTTGCSVCVYCGMVILGIVGHISLSSADPIELLANDFRIITYEGECYMYFSNLD